MTLFFFFFLVFFLKLSLHKSLLYSIPAPNAKDDVKMIINLQNVIF